MSRAQAESVIKNIIREIAQECASKGQAVSETLVAFMVKLSTFLSILVTVACSLTYSQVPTCIYNVLAVNPVCCAIGDIIFFPFFLYWIDQFLTITSGAVEM